MILKNIILHQIIREDNGEPILNLSEVELDVNNSIVQEFIIAIIKSFRKKSPTYGTFQNDKAIYPFQTYVQEYFDGASFIEFSTKSMNILKKEIKVPSARGGYVCFVHYEERNQDYILTVMLEKAEQFTTDDDTLDIKKLLMLDIAKLAMANRLNTIKWINEEDSYLSFIKGTRTVSDYFRKFIGNTDLTSARINTKNLKKAVDQYMYDNEYSQDEKFEVKKKMKDYFDKQYKEEEDIKLTAISAFVNQEEPTQFVDYIQESDIEVSGDYRLNKKSDFNNIGYGNVKEAGYKLTFEKYLIKTNKIVRDGSNIIIKDVPEEILDREFSS